MLVDQQWFDDWANLFTEDVRYVVVLGVFVRPARICEGAAHMGLQNAIF